MNKTIKIVYCSLLASLFIICESCNDKPRTTGPGVVILDLKSGDGIRRSIDIISVPSVWTQARFDSINTAINTLASAGALNRNINEDKKHLANLFTSSASCLERKVDSIFRQPVYTGYAQMKNDLSFLNKYFAIYLNAGVNIDSINPSLVKVTDLFAEYDDRLKKSQRQFDIKAVYLKAYPYSEKSDYYKNAVDKIKSDKPKAYWTTYFSHNTEIVNGVNAFPSRLSRSRSDYYAALEILVENKAIEENFSKEELEAVEKSFYNMATGYNQKAIDKLGKFRENYTPKPEETTEQ